MPSLLTHYLCGDMTISLLKNKEINNVINKHRQSFNLGTQGPDIFFYYGAWPWSKVKGYSKIGNLMHEERTGSFFENALLYTKNQDSETLVAYLLGYLCHYSLDIHTHPYIFYKTGFVLRGEEPTLKFSCYHRMFETMVDILMSKYLLNKKPSDIKTWKLIKVSSDEAQAIGLLYSNVLKTVYGIDISVEQTQNAISDIIGISRALKDRTGLKRSIIQYMEKTSNKSSLISSMIHPLKVNDNLDYLNLQHSPWCYPWDNQNLQSSTFIEMFEAAVYEASKLCEAAYNYLTGQEDIQDTIDKIGSRSYSSGIDCTLPIEFHYYDCIYK